MLPLTTLHRHLRWVALAAIVISISMENGVPLIAAI